MAHSIDGNLAEWTKSDRIDLPGEGATGFAVYGTLEAGAYVFALQAPDALLPDTKLWLNTDRKSSTGFQSFDGAGTGAEYYVNFYSDGKPYLYSISPTGATGPAVLLQYAYSSDGKSIEFSVPQNLLTPDDTDLNLDVKVNINHGVAGSPQAQALPGFFAAAALTVYDPATLPPHPTDAHKIGIVYSETTAAKYFGGTPAGLMAYSQLFMAAQNQAVAAGLSFDVLSENDLTKLDKIAGYDTLVFPSFGNVKGAEAGQIQDVLTQAVYKYGVNLITAGDFMVKDENNALLGADPYIRMKTLLNIESSGNTGTVPITVKANDLSNPMLEGYTAGETIHSYASMASNYYKSADGTDVSHIATMSFGSSSVDAVIGTQTGGRNVHFANESLLGDNNMLQHALDSVEKPAAGPELSLKISRAAAVVASRSDMDQAQEVADVNGTPAPNDGIYDKMLPILDQWKKDFNFVGSYYIDIGSDPNGGQTTDWTISAPYYKQMLDMGNEIGSHTISHPEDTNALLATNPTQFATEFRDSKTTIEGKLGITVAGAAVPGAPELLPTAQAIEEYYTYVTGGTTLIGAGYPGAIGHLTPTDSKVYIAPNVSSDFTLIGFQGKDATTAASIWQDEFKSLTTHSDMPVIVWPWHDYGVTEWPIDGTTSKYSTGMFTSFIKTAYDAGSEFVTLADLAERMSAFDAASFNYQFDTTANAVTAVVGSASAGKFSLDLGNAGTIKSVTGYYAYDANSVFVDKDGGTFQINLGSTPDDVTHITKVADRGDLISVVGDGTNLDFSMVGEGHVLVDLVAPAGRQVVVTGAGATVSSLVDDKLDILLTGLGRHDVSIKLAPTTTTNHAPMIAGALVGGATEGGPVATFDLLAGASDPDQGESATLAVKNLAYTIDGAPSTTIPTGLTLDATAHTLTIDPANAVFDSLAVGSKRVLVASYDIVDIHGASIPQTETLTVTGVNDAPMVAGPLAASVTEGGPVAHFDLLSGATDPDAGETATLAVKNITYTIDGTPSATVPAGLAYDDATHTLSVDPTNAAFTALAAGTQRTFVASYDVADVNGALARQTQTLTVKGIDGVPPVTTNHAPVVAGPLTASVTEDGPVARFDLLSGATDPDAGETATLVVKNVTFTVDGTPSTGVPTGLAYDTATHTLTVDPADATFDPLAAGAQRTFVASYDIVDIHGAVAQQTQTLTVKGIDVASPPVTPPVTPPAPPSQPPSQPGNQTPMVTAALVASVTEDGPVAGFDLLAGASDPDAGETETLAIRNLAFSIDGGAASETVPEGLRYDAATHRLIVDPADAVFDSLTANDHRVFVASYDVIDVHGASVRQTQTLTVLGIDVVSIPGAEPPAPAEPPTIPSIPTVPPLEPTVPPSVPPSQPANGAPVANGDVGSGIAYKTPATGNVLSNDTDPNGDTLHVAAVRFDNGVTAPIPTSGSVQVTGQHGVLVVAANGDYRYAATSSGSDTFVYTVADPAGLSAQATLRIDSTKPAPLGSETFAFKLGEATFDFSHGHSVMRAPDGTVTDLTGIGTITFADGTVQERDGQPGVDDLYYAAQNPDVWRAGLDPDQHYAQYGWREGRNPNTEFSTNAYLKANPDVAAAGLNPLQHYDTYGWKEGRSAGPDFSAEAYLAKNPDVAAAGLNPLLHYEEYGKAEGRFAFPGAVTAANGHEIYGDFDATYYLAANPDVAAAVPANHDAEGYAFEHYNTYGWREGRDPNALFSTNGYLAANPDVAAQGLNPLLHQEEIGWRQGRSSGTAFDNNAYLAANPDVAAAQMDPLQHYLQYGMAEGRHLA